MRCVPSGIILSIARRLALTLAIVALPIASRPILGDPAIGTVYTWGSSQYEQLGYNPGPCTGSYFCGTPTAVPGLGDATAVSGGWGHSLALQNSGTIQSWGWNSRDANLSWGQLGAGSMIETRMAPGAVVGLTGVTAISAGYWHTLAVKSDGTVWAFGANTRGALGDGTTTDRLAPVQVVGLTGATAVAAGQWVSVALRDDGTVWAWGDNSNGALGIGVLDGSNHPTPAQVPGMTGVTAIASNNASVLALKSDGTVWGWGYNGWEDGGRGSLGIPYTAPGYSPTPAQVAGLTDIVAISNGTFESLALKSDGTVWGWGNNQYGGVGNGTSSLTTTPVQVLSGAAAIASGAWHSLALMIDGTVMGWGMNHVGQVHGSYGFMLVTPSVVPGLSGVGGIAAGGFHSLAVTGPIGGGGGGGGGGDSTPPAIAPTVSGTLGSGGWYTSNVNVSWTVTDAESAISASTGCGASTVSTDTAGVTFTCSATSGGGSASQSVTIKRDATLPSIAVPANISTPATSAAGAVVTYSAPATDGLSGIASATCAPPSGSTFAAGTMNVTCIANDNAGNSNTATFQVTVTKGAAQLLADLLALVNSVNGPGNSLNAKVLNAQAAFGAGNTALCASHLKSLLNEVSAQSGKKLTAAQANAIATLTNQILALL